MHSILHNWADDTCVEILRNIASAMQPGYSKLIINEHVLASSGAHWEATSKDVLMLALFGSKERSLPEWEVLLEEAGLRVCDVWSIDQRQQSVIECELLAEMGSNDTYR